MTVLAARSPLSRPPAKLGVMKNLLAWLPWIVGILLALALFRFVAGLALRLIGLVIVIVLVYLVWRALTGRG